MFGACNGLLIVYSKLIAEVQNSKFKAQSLTFEVQNSMGTGFRCCHLFLSGYFLIQRYLSLGIFFQGLIIQTQALLVHCDTLCLSFHFFGDN